MADRTAPRITTIGAIDCSKAEPVERRKGRKRNRVEAGRRAAGAVPREQYEANSLSRTRPWEALGISRRTWERRRKAPVATPRGGRPREAPGPAPRPRRAISGPDQPR
jgi:hypothetical protein